MNTTHCINALLLALAIPMISLGENCFEEKFDTLPPVAANVPGFSLIDEAAPHGGVLKIERIDKIHQCVRFPLTLPEGKNISLSFEYKGSGYFFLLNAGKEQMMGGGIDARGKLQVISEKQNKWVFTGLYIDPKEWVKLTFNFDFTNKNFTLLLTGNEGEKEVGPFAFAAEGTPAILQFGNAYPVGNVSYLDNIVIQPLQGQAGSAGEITLIQQDFEKETKEIKNGGSDFSLEAEPEKAETFHKSLKIVRSSKVHNAVNFRFQRLLPAQTDFVISCDYKGVGYVFVQDAKKKQIGGVIFAPQIKVLAGEQNRQISANMANDVNTWAHYDIYFQMSKGVFSIKRTAVDGTVTESGPFELAGKTAPVQLQFGNSYPIGNTAYLDNLKVVTVK